MPSRLGFIQPERNPMLNTQSNPRPISPRQQLLASLLPEGGKANVALFRAASVEHARCQVSASITSRHALLIQFDEA